MNKTLKEKGPILITGTFRSGTTLISQMIRNHSNIELIYDSVNFMRFSYNNYNPIDDFSNVKKLVKEILNRIKKRWDMEFDYREVIKKLEKEEINYALIYDTIMSDLLLKESSADIWGEKTTLVWTKIPDFFSMFPNGRVIHIIRDPRAVLASWRKMTHAPGNDYLDSILNCRSSMELAKKYKNDFANNKYKLMKFEDLIENPEKEIKDTCKKLDLNFEKNMLNTSKFTDKKGEKWDGNSMYDKKIKGISKKTKDKWKDKLSDWEIWLAEYINSDLMDVYNYKKMEPKKTEKLMDVVIKNIQDSDVVTNGILKYIFKEKGQERFPDDPFDEKNWEDEIT